MCYCKEMFMGGLWKVYSKVYSSVYGNVYSKVYGNVYDYCWDLVILANC